MSETTISLQVSSKDILKKKHQNSLRDTGDAEKGANRLQNHCLKCFRWTVPSREMQKRKASTSLSNSPLSQPDEKAKLPALRRLRLRTIYL